ncbi:MAG TPA: DUF4270 domain-containing protein [Chitinophagaceae bacterium]|nr:DUF4270 domain-containing protein [Chitinophagaceae bacterium]
MSKHIRYIFLSLLIVGFISSCKKKTPADIGLPLLPGEDLLNAQFMDSLTLIAHTVKDDSLPIQSSSLKLTTSLLGNINDPIFGITRASVFNQLSLSKTNPTFGTNPVLDSAVLSLVYNSGQYYGNLTPQQFDVYELSEAIYKDSTYYSDDMRSYYSTQQIGSETVIPNVTDSVHTADDTIAPHLRIHLSTELFKHFIDTTSPLGYTSSYSTNLSFQNKFKGIYIKSSTTPVSGDGAVLYINIAHSNTRLTLYYHNTTDTTSYYFGLNSECARFSHFEHDYSMTADIQSQLNDTNTSVAYDKVFVQPMAGVRTKITMPFINDLFKNEKIAINKAELVLPVDANSVTTAFTAHPKLVATIADPTLGPVFMPDYFEGATYFGGDYDSTKKEYRFNIARYVQQVLNGTRANQGLYIITNVRPTTANRVQLNGGNALINRMRLKITFTPLE